MKRLKSISRAVTRELRQNKSSFLVYLILRALVILTLVRQMFLGNYENVFLCLLTLVLLVLPSLVQVGLRIELPSLLEIIMMLFVFSAEILGEIDAYYIRIPNWDTVLHTLNGFLMAAIGFSLVDILNRDARLKFSMSPLFMAIVAFCFSMTVGVVWEFFEYSMDQIFKLDMQKDTVIHMISSVMLDPQKENTPMIIRDIQDVVVNGRSLELGGYLDIGLHDTMEDLFVNFIGATIFSVIGFFYMKHRGKKSLARYFIPELKTMKTTETQEKTAQ